MNFLTTARRNDYDNMLQTTCENKNFHSFIYLFHIPLILYRCGTSHVYI